MRLLFVADGRSPTAQSWIYYWIGAGHEVHLISTFPCSTLIGLRSFHILPIVFARFAGQPNANRYGYTLLSNLLSIIRPYWFKLRYILGPLSLVYRKREFRSIVSQIAPEIVHALRIPFEGMLASALTSEQPLVVSIWGNDLSLHAVGSKWMSALTRVTLRRTDGLIADAARDIRLGIEWGYGTGKPTLVVPGSGGIRTARTNFKPGTLPFPEQLPNAPLIINPRGQRPGSLRQDIFFQSIPLVLKKCPQAQFVCPSLAGDWDSEHWIKELNIQRNIKLWPRLDQDQLLFLYSKAQIYVSPSVHDGTPNSMLEAMACGCYPVVGNIESMQEWITPDINGTLVDATSSSSLAEGIVSALENSARRIKARRINRHLISERADYAKCMAAAESFYLQLIRIDKD